MTDVQLPLNNTAKLTIGKNGCIVKLVSIVYI